MKYSWRYLNNGELPAKRALVMSSSSLDLQENLGNRHVCLRLLCLERLQTGAARIVLKDSNLSQHQQLCQLSWKSLKARSTMHNLTFAFKCLHNIAWDLFKSYFIYSSHVYSTRRNGLDIFIPKVRTESAKKGTFYTWAQAFINLQRHLKEVDSIAIFKTLLTDIIFRVLINLAAFRPRQHVCGYFWVRNFFFPDTNFHVHTYLGLKSNLPVHTYSDIFESANFSLLGRPSWKFTVKKWARSCDVSGLKNIRI